MKRFGDPEFNRFAATGILNRYKIDRWKFIRKKAKQTKILLIKEQNELAKEQKEDFGE